MYNIHSHYETIFHSLSSIVTYRRVLYLLPYGSTQPENLERIADNIGHTSAEIKEGPLFIFYDQEPILGPYNFKLFDYITDTYQGPFILVTTEKNSKPLTLIKERYGWETVYYFHHAFAAHDWFRGYRYSTQLISPIERKLKKKYITFNRLTSNLRVYRTLLIAELAKLNILNEGYVSYNDICPDGGDYQTNLQNGVDKKLYSQELADNSLEIIDSICKPLRIDYKTESSIPNHSFVLSAIPESQESFLYLVTETCFWEHKDHLTEKIFKPIVSRMPFIIVGTAHSLKYLRSYGFKTFNTWIDESYDDIEDPIARLEAIGKIMSNICSYSLTELESILNEMNDVLEFNYNHFYSNNFLDGCWQELQTNLANAVLSLPTDVHVPSIEKS